MASVTAQSLPARPFPPNHPWDRNFFLLYAVLIWTGILVGFGGELVTHFAHHEAAFPLIVHFHAAAFVGWLILFTAQILLIRTRRWEVHRKLGYAMAGLAAVMAVIGPATALHMDRLDFEASGDSPAFLSVQFTDIIAFVGLTGAAILLRNTSSTHKRLILMGTVYISDAGFARWFGGPIHSLLGQGYWPFLAGAYLANDVLFLGIGAYDLITRRRSHPAYLAGLAWVFGLQLIAGWLYYSPAWKAVALRMIGH